ncbi:DUF5665 domain-containing protein [Desulfolucanica intricata]|uniref:DUF5665 domain-containing protein n=1 Tax=Desulfolucanica intricata TaxID=1285191 RepID=UPI000834B145|nr:DUF5665 domain-containing protein [Desulfolucanica intricata]
MKNTQETLIKSLEERIDKLAVNMEKMKLAEYVDLLEHTKKLLYINFISGVARGLGIAVGFAILGALVIYLLRSLLVLNLPVIGGFIAEIIKIVQLQLGR